MSERQRAYWIEQLDAAWDFMQAVLAARVEECREPMDCLKDAAAAAGLDILFPEGRHLGLFDRRFHLRRSLVGPLLTAAEALRRRGYRMRIEDAYRSLEAQAAACRSQFVLDRVLELVAWETGAPPRDAELVFRRLSAWSATTPIFANHTAGSAVDVSLLTPAGEPLDLGSPYPEFSIRTPMASPFIPPAARRLRDLLCEVLGEQGFGAYPFEFWHFSRGDADAAVLAGRDGPGPRRDGETPARYGPVHLADDGSLRPATDLRRPFITLDEIDRYIRTGEL